MQLGEVFERFIQQAPISVMFRTLLEHALDPTAIDRLFEENADRQYTREILFSSIVELMGAVVCGAQPSVRAAYLAALGEVAASLSALYEKLKGLEPGVCRAFVRDNAGRLAPLVRQLDAALPQPIPGYRAKILDGNHLAGTEHRPKVTRTTRAAVLPGQSLVVLDPAAMLVLDVVPCEDAHAQERSLVDQVLPGVEPGDLWIADRNFCTTRLVFGTIARGGSFLVRQHKSTLYWGEATPWAAVGRTATGVVSEQAITVTQADGSGAIPLRRIRLELDRPTEDKETELFLLTNVPGEQADALSLATAYRERWRVENVFQTLTEALTCEVNTLGYPRAALFGFCVALVAYNVLATVRAALRSEHGREAVEAGVSNYHLANEVAATYEGMMIALPPSAWAPLGRLSLAEVADFLREVASQAWLAKYPRTVRGPKKPPPKHTSGRRNHHESTARLLHRQTQQK
jgi:Transposase DDE domain